MAGWYFLTVPICKYVEDRLTGEAESGVWVARARTYNWANGGSVNFFCAW